MAHVAPGDVAKLSATTAAVGEQWQRRLLGTVAPMAAPLRVNRLSIGGTAQGQGVGGLTPLQPVQALGPIKGGPPLFSIHSGNEPFQARRTTFPVNHVAGAEMASPGSELRTPRSVFNKTVLVAPSEPPPPVARTMHANHPRSKVKRRNTFSKNSKVLKEGVLMKMKVMDRLHEGEKAWHKRHFQIRDGFFLWFPAKGPRKKPSGWVRVRDVMAVRVCDAAMGLPGVDSESVTRSFQVTTTARALYLRARTIEDMQEWMKMLVSSKCLTPAVHKSFAFPDIAGMGLAWRPRRWLAMSVTDVVVRSLLSRPSGRGPPAKAVGRG